APGVLCTAAGLRIEFAGERRQGVSVLAVRPERMAILRGSGGAERPNSFAATLRVVTFLGPTTEAMIELASGERVIVHAPTAQWGGAGPAPGEAGRGAWPPGASPRPGASDHAPAPNQ